MDCGRKPYIANHHLYTPLAMPRQSSTFPFQSNAIDAKSKVVNVVTSIQRSAQDQIIHEVGIIRHISRYSSIARCRQAAEAVEYPIPYSYYCLVLLTSWDYTTHPAAAPFVDTHYQDSSAGLDFLLVAYLDHSTPASLLAAAQEGPCSCSFS